MRKIIAVFFLFLVAFDPQIPLLPNGIGFTFVVVFVLFIPAILKIVNRKSYFYISKSKPFIVLFLMLFLFILFRIIFNYGGNIEFFLSLFKAFFVFVSVVFVFIVFFEQGLDTRFIKVIAFIYILNALINFFAGTYPASFEFLNIFRSEVVSDSLGSNPYRNSFISGSGYYSVGTAYGLVVLLLSFYIVKNRIKGLLTTLSLFAIAIAGFIAARTSFFAIAPALFYIFKSRLVYFFYFSIVGILLIYFLLDLPELQPYRVWMLSFFDLSNDSSGSYLIEKMYFWPSTDIFLYGKGFVNDGTFVYTDGGYMKDILFGGVCFVLLKLSFLGVFVFNLFRKYPLFTILFSFSILAFHFKGLFLYNNAQGMAVFYFTYYYLVSSKDLYNLKRVMS